MKRPPEKAVKEVQRFARERNAIFERARRVSAAKFEAKFDAAKLLKDPVGYSKALWARLGGEVVRELMPKAERAGRKHAERLLAAAHQGPELR